MKLILAISVVIVALSVLAGPSSAHAEESSVRDKIGVVADSVKGFFNKAHEKIKNVYEEARTSEFGTKTRTWFDDIGKKIKEKLSKK